MENRLELNLDDQKKTEEDVARLPIYGFIKKNFALWDALYRNEFRIHRLSDEIEKGSSLLGEIDRKEKMKEIDDLRCEEGAILDKLIKKLNKAKVAGGIPDSEDLYDAYDLADSVINSTERDVDADDDESDDDGDAADPLDDCQEEHIPDISQMLRRRMATKESARKLGSLKSKKEIKAILDDEHSRLEKVRKLLNQSPEKNSDPDAFDPQKDLLAISKKSAGDVLVEGGEKPSATKKEQLERFKNEMAFQAFGMGKINHFLENKLSQSDMVDLDALYFEFESKAKEYKLTDWQIERYRSVFTTFKEAIKKKDADVEKYKDMSNVEIVKQVSGYGCKGEVEMEAHPFIHIFTLSNNEDFARILSHKTANEELTPEDHAEAKGCAGFYNGGVIFLPKMDDQLERNESLIHEVKHGINELILNGINGDIIQKYVHAGLAVRNIKEYFVNELDYALNQARNEILAHFKGGEDSDEILSNMTELGAYDYLSESKYERQKTENGEEGGYNDKILEKYKPEMIKKELVKSQEKYKKIISEALDVMDDLGRWGFPRGEIIGMFQVQELKYWKKLLERLKRNPQFIKERTGNSHEKAAQFEEELRQHRKNNSWLKRKIDKLKIKLPFGLSDRISPESYEELLLEKELKLLNKERLGWKQGKL